jgi:RNA polymerase sigma factor (sigma-70 family)
VDTDQFDRFYDTEYVRHVSALALVTGDRDVARDSVDEALARAWERVRAGRTIEGLGAWVRVVALNVARGRYRQAKRERNARARLVSLGEVDSLLGAERAIDVRRALAGLPRRQREVTVLYYFLDLSVDQIARELGVAGGTVKATLHSARLALATELERDDEVTDGHA